MKMVAVPTMTVMITRANTEAATFPSPLTAASCQDDEVIRRGRLHDDPQGSRRCDRLSEPPPRNASKCVRVLANVPRSPVGPSVTSVR
jgi:hypothetical protein